LAEFLPATEIQPKDSLGYLIGYRQEGSEEIIPLIMTGNLQKKNRETDRILESDNSR
jgi:hypothetical protein